MLSIAKPCIAGYLLLLLASPALATVDEDEVGAWYMYMWNHDRSDSRFGLQGDVQYRNWDLLGDMEQLLIRGGLTWRPENTPVKLTFGAANITTGEYGSRSRNTTENRLYQEALIPHRLGSRLQVTHRLRLEQRDVEGQSTRNRFRYFLALNYPLNQDTLGRGAIYLSVYNEIFLNLEKDIGNGRRVDTYDRNRVYAAIGYGVSDSIRLQFGVMRQDTDPWAKNQLQLNLFHNF
ncbi:DUF2490 domain-containing protein [Chromatocurvus halotolerans]|uniref:Uncharacterized protein DUF2490 n=1 Tax=Chromatocurvus halotolerans TaxID=1132028 RepID=A0A4R2LA18_9GAMM|nr:DUF2490 domain-containing protein [Chromatocurvus halotolerans]TCO76095.1 uncharacterized protein DUF2490 [Chromatocurvus halotolerans]